MARPKGSKNKTRTVKVTVDYERIRFDYLLE